jgi:hypothetical protein
MARLYTLQDGTRQVLRDEQLLACLDSERPRAFPGPRHD